MKKPTKKPTTTITRYAVLAVDNGESCDGRPIVLGFFNTREEAREYVKKDIGDYEGKGHTDIDYNDMSCDTCVWNIEKIEIEL